METATAPANEVDEILEFMPIKFWEKYIEAMVPIQPGEDTEKVKATLLDDDVFLTNVANMWRAAYVGDKVAFYIAAHNCRYIVRASNRKHLIPDFARLLAWYTTNSNWRPENQGKWYEIEAEIDKDGNWIPVKDILRGIRKKASRTQHGHQE